MPYEAARRLAQGAGLPLVLDMRDPWRLQQRLNEHVASPLWFRLAERYERRCVAQAALVVTNTEPFRDAMRRTYPDHAERIIAVMNGIDEEPIPEVPPDPRFVVAYAGAIYLDRDPGPLLRAGARVIREEGLSPEQFRIEFIGNTESYGGVPVAQIAASAGITEYVGTGPPRPRGEAMAFLARATLLVSLPQDSDLAIPSKVFEYLNFKAWVLALATPESATGLALAGTGADLADPGDEAAIAEVLRRHWREFAAGSRPGRPAGTAGLRRRAQARILFDALAPLLNRA
jgi:glycosyltransferase involved in cell wall biosynthesis